MKYSLLYWWGKCWNILRSIEFCAWRIICMCEHFEPWILNLLPQHPWGWELTPTGNGFTTTVILQSVGGWRFVSFRWRYNSHTVKIYPCERWAIPVVFSIFMRSCNHHFLIQNICITPERRLVPMNSNLSPLPSPCQPGNHESAVSLDLPILDMP